MMMRMFVAAVVTAALGATTAAAAPDTLAVALATVSRADTVRAVHVTVRFRGDDADSTVLDLPDAWGGEERLYRGLRDLRVTGATLSDGADAAHRVLRHRPGAPLVVEYDVVQDWDGVPQAGGRNEYRPVIQPAYVHLLGETILAFPHGREARLARFDGFAVPSGWTVASDLQHTGGPHPMRLGDVLESITVAGDFRVVHGPSPGSKLRVALRGQWAFTDSALAAKIDRIIASHLRFWGDADEPYLVTVLPLVAAPGNSSLGGTGRGDAFAFFATDNAQDATLNRILAHEHLHTWIPRRLGVMPEGAEEPRDYWLSEGFTDYFTNRLLVRDGIWSLEDYADATNEVLAAYAQSPVRSEPNDRIVRDFWSNPDVQKLPYQRGFLLAMHWDEAIRRASHGRRGFDDVVLAMRAQHRAAHDADTTHALARLLPALRAAGVDGAADIARYIDRGEPLLVPADWYGPGARVETSEVPEFTRGFDGAATSAAHGVVAGVDSAGPAYAAGLRDGMTIVKREAGKPGDSAVELVYRVKDGGAERVIRYLPAGARRYTTQRVVLDAALTAEARAALTKRIGG